MKQYEMAKILDVDFKHIDSVDISIVDVNIPSVPLENIWTGGSDGIVPVWVGTDIKQREIGVVIMTDALDLDDYYLLRSEIYSAFSGGNVYYLTLDREPAKRYRIILNDSYTPERKLPTISEITVPFITNKLPYAESVITSDYIDVNGLNYDDIMTYGLGFSYHENEHVFRNTFSKFRIFNPGSVTINPVEFDLRIEIDKISISGFTMKNKTTGDLFKIDKKLSNSDKVVLDKATILINNANAFRETNREFISLAPGWNYFELNTNANTFFDFRFYYD